MKAYTVKKPFYQRLITHPVLHMCIHLACFYEYDMSSWVLSSVHRQVQGHLLSMIIAPISRTVFGCCHSMMATRCLPLKMIKLFCADHLFKGIVSLGIKPGYIVFPSQK
jgi:hypothetical protein